MDHIYSVSEITDEIKALLEGSIAEFDLQAEISEIKYHSSGHLYFTLKDNSAVMPAVMWRSHAASLIVRPRAGDSVVCRGRLSVYPPHGRYQFVARSMKSSGQGDLYLKFEALKNKLSLEGVFDRDRKALIPSFPLHVAMLTSRTGAALQDMLRVFANAAPHIRITVFPVRVQGEGSAVSMIRALDTAEKYKPAPDCIILARGGGSIEDLWEFNDESLARHIAACKIPVISGVGHETDFTICDFCSDHRASTPTAAAEFCARYWQESPEQLAYLDSRLIQAIDRLLDNTDQRLNITIQSHGFRRHSDLLNARKDKLQGLMKQLQNSALHRLDEFAQQLKNLTVKRDLLHPQNILQRGYSINRNASGEIIRSIDQITVGEMLYTQFAQGTGRSEIKELKRSSND